MPTALQSLAVPLLWIAWSTYWYAASANSKAIHRSEDRLSRASHVVPLAVAMLLLAVPTTSSGVFDQRFLPRSQETYWIGALIVMLGLAFTVWARTHLGANWSGIITIKQGHDLIRSGPYRLVRHPIYTGLLIAFIGSAIARGEWRGMLAVSFAFAALWRKLAIEERWLTDEFGPAYEAYRAEVPALVPYLL
jgi:protein-S-isoprenylcysteine O-methyltransferase Ste14